MWRWVFSPALNCPRLMDDERRCGESAFQTFQSPFPCKNGIVRRVGKSIIQILSKTEVMWCASSRRMHQVPDNVTPVSSVRDLGVYLDADASMTTHISRTAAICFGILHQLRSVQRSLPRHAGVSLVTSLVLTKLDYCNSLLVGLPVKLLNRLQAVINTTARLVLSCYEGRSHYTCVERPTLATNPGKDPVQAMCPCVQVST